MKQTILLFASVLIYSIASKAQTAGNYFNLTLVNNSNYTTTAAIQGTDKIDSVRPKESKTIHFELDRDFISFNLNLWTTDISATSYRSKTIRVLNKPGAKKISVTAKNELLAGLTKSEKIVADYNPRLRTKNFWKLDTIINKNQNDIAAAEIIYLSLCDVDVKADTIKNYFNKLRPKIRSSAFGKRIVNYLKARSLLTVGNLIDNISLPDTSGTIIQLSNIKSRYILLDFWFSRCGPCIKSFPELQRLYSETNRDDFEIAGISIDVAGDKELWKSSIVKYGLSWLNMNDPKSATSKKLAIVNYPTKILLDKNRKIILVDTDNSYADFYLQIKKLVSQQ